MRIYLENIKDRVRYIIRMREDLVDNGLKVAAGEGALSVVVTFVTNALNLSLHQHLSLVCQRR
jgi:hypothetical protein